jgi:type IV pilus assembly protein PilV
MIALSYPFPPVTPARRQAGFSMIEVLVAIVIIAFGLLGLMGTQAVSHQAERESYQRAQALILLNDMVERINSNRDSAACYAVTNAAIGTPYLGTSTGGGYLGTPDCTSGFVNVQTKDLADSGMTEWDLALQGASEASSSGAAIGAMTDARGCVSYDAATQTYTVAVAWQGATDTFTPVVNCGNGLYGAETKRRVVWTTLKIANLT